MGHTVLGVAGDDGIQEEVDRDWEEMDVEGKPPEENDENALYISPEADQIDLEIGNDAEYEVRAPLSFSYVEEIDNGELEFGFEMWKTSRDYEKQLGDWDTFEFNSLWGGDGDGGSDKPVALRTKGYNKKPVWDLDSKKSKVIPVKNTFRYTRSKGVRTSSKPREGGDSTKTPEPVEKRRSNNKRGSSPDSSGSDRDTSLPPKHKNPAYVSTNSTAEKSETNHGSTCSKGKETSSEDSTDKPKNSKKENTKQTKKVGQKRQRNSQPRDSSTSSSDSDSALSFSPKKRPRK